MSPYIKVFLHTKIKHNHVVGKYELTILVAMSNALWDFLFIKPKVSHKMSTERKWNLFFRICYTPLKVEIMKIQNSYFLLLNWKKFKSNKTIWKKKGPRNFQIYKILFLNIIHLWTGICLCFDLSLFITFFLICLSFVSLCFVYQIKYQQFL